MRKGWPSGDCSGGWEHCGLPKSLRPLTPHVLLPSAQPRGGPHQAGGACEEALGPGGLHLFIHSRTPC